MGSRVARSTGRTSKARISPVTAMCVRCASRHTSLGDLCKGQACTTLQIDVLAVHERAEGV